jgi:hypothetical protein
MIGKRFAVCPLAPGCLWWEGLGHSQHVKHVTQPVKRYAKSADAKNFASQHANEYNNGLVIVDTYQDKVWDGEWMAISDTGEWGKNE